MSSALAGVVTSSYVTGRLGSSLLGEVTSAALAGTVHSSTLSIAGYGIATVDYVVDVADEYIYTLAGEHVTRGNWDAASAFPNALTILAGER